MRTWNVGNTSMRNPYRMEKALRLVRDYLEGKVFHAGKEWQLTLFEGLKKEGIVQTSNAKEPALLARKWTSSPEQLGFIVKSGSKKEISLSLTPAGKALLEQTIPAADIFLRQLLKYRLPNHLENKENIVRNFSIHPLWFFTKTLYELQFESESPLGLNKDEIGLFLVPCIHYEKCYERCKELLLEYRNAYKDAHGLVAKRAVYARFLQLVKTEFDLRIKDNTPADYADSNVRYLSRTGLFSLRGERIWIDETKKTLAEFVIREGLRIAEHLTPEQFEDAAYPILPSENRDYLEASIKNLSQIGKQEALGLEIATVPSDIPTAQLRRIEEKLEEQLKKKREEKFMADQESQIPDIIETFERIMAKQFLGGNIYQPAFYEWNIWRAFLAMNHLQNHVSQTRRFQIDASMYPVHHAKGGLSDMLFEYEDRCIAVEATTATGENQWSMEAEPVTRHIKDEMLKQQKPVMGIFIAPKISLNTYQNFIDCKLYLHQDSEGPTRIDVVPLTHAQFCILLSHYSEIRDPSFCKHVFEEILHARKDGNGKQWMKEIMTLVPNAHETPSLF